MAESSFADRFPTVADVYEQGWAAGLHRGAQVYIAQAGDALADVGLGESRPGVPMDRDAIVLWLSAGKPITAVAIMQLWEQGRLDLDNPVSRYLPEFAQQGKQAVTLRHLLTHTSGFRFAPGLDDLTWNEAIERICAMERDWQPGRRAGYHPTTSWFILGEVVQRLDGRPFWRYVREEILLPLGMNDSWIGMPSEQFRRYGTRMAPMIHTEKPQRPIHFYSTEQGAAQGAPGGAAQGPTWQLGRFYEYLLAGGERDSPRILKTSTVELMRCRHREGMFDETFRATIDWGLGFLLDSKRYGVEQLPYGYGRYASDSTFGHGGSQSSVAFADPAHRLVVAVVFVGMPGEAHHQERMRRTLEGVYVDLGLAS
jgi:CubicO group peptidase (beta-lactamase class C family)